ncbi:hypothetical protein B1776_05345 [Dehalococcoides mccartyi]|jgi:hypothetical protein|nr:hypothetical protein B1776_05345 [Dehalococcoides mccartyi]
MKKRELNGRDQSVTLAQAVGDMGKNVVQVCLYYFFIHYLKKYFTLFRKIWQKRRIGICK